MSRAPRPRAMSSSTAFACPACHRVVPQLQRIRYGLGLVDVGPIDRCDGCVDGLRRLEREHEQGRTLGSPVWGIEVLETIGGGPAEADAPQEPVPPRKVARERKRALGGVGV